MVVFLLISSFTGPYQLHLPLFLSLSYTHTEYNLSFTLEPNQELGFCYHSSLKRHEIKIRSAGNMQNQPFQGQNSERNGHSNFIVGSDDVYGTQLG